MAGSMLYVCVYLLSLLSLLSSVDARSKLDTEDSLVKGRSRRGHNSKGTALLLQQLERSTASMGKERETPRVVGGSTVTGDLVAQKPRAHLGKIPAVVHIFSKRCNTKLGHQAAWRRMGFDVRCYNNDEQLAECAKAGLDINESHMAVHVSDICRFAVLYNYGGIYTDLDVEPNGRYRGSIDSLLDPKYGVILGFEADMKTAVERAKWHQVMPRSLCMWTVLSLPGAQVMLDLAKALASNLRPRRFGETLEHYVHTTTGPTAITQFFEKKYPEVMIHPVNLFGCGQMHSHSGRCDGPTAFVRHHFHGTWRSDEKLVQPRNAERKPVN